MPETQFKIENSDSNSEIHNIEFDKVAKYICNIMENRHLKYCIIISALIMFSCTENKSTILETPFVTVVKLISAEQSLAFEEAIQYIDVIQVYSKLGLENPEADWKEMIKLQYNLGKDKKLSNNFKYYDYNIEETITENNAVVCFKAKNTNSSIKKITYGLEKRQNRWIIIYIDYFK